MKDKLFKIFKIFNNFILLTVYGYMFSLTIGAIKITYNLYNIHYYSLNKCIENYIVLGLGSLIIFIIFITILVISYITLKTKKN